jgi:hypothetical protein
MKRKTVPHSLSDEIDLGYRRESLRRFVTTQPSNIALDDGQLHGQPRGRFSDAMPGAPAKPGMRRAPAGEK